MIINDVINHELWVPILRPKFEATRVVLYLPLGVGNGGR